jgi:hypothetical protein
MEHLLQGDQIIRRPATKAVDGLVSKMVAFAV